MSKHKGPQFVMIEDVVNSRHCIRCMYPIVFKVYIFHRTDKPDGFYLVPEKDTPDIRRIVKNMNRWYEKLLKHRARLSKFEEGDPEALS